VLLLVVSETGLVYTFTTAKLQPLVTQPEGKNLIQACLNAPHGQLPAPSSGGGQPMNRMSNSTSQPARSNVPGGLSIGGNKEDEAEGDEEDETGNATPTSTKPRTRRRTSSGAVAGGISATTGATQKGPSNSPTSPNQQTPPQSGMALHQQPGGSHPQMALNPSHGQPPQYSAGHATHNQVPNVSPYSNPTDASGGYMSSHGHTGHPQMLAQYHLNQPANHQPPQHWGGQPAQSVTQNTQYGRR
jgi:pheromone receptor transcription factor